MILSAPHLDRPPPPPPPLPDLNLPSLVDVGLGTRYACPVAPPCEYSVPVSVLQLRVRRSGTDNLSNERADVTWLLDEEDVPMSADGEHSYRSFSVNVSRLFVRQGVS